MKKIEILKVKDDAEKYYTAKSQIFDLPMKIAIIGASQRSGKTNEDELEALYDDVEDEYNTAIDEKKRPPNKIVVFDDLGFGGAMRGTKFGIIDKLVCNGRHFNLSSAFLIQSYKQISPDVRGNLSGLVVFNLSTRELESIVHEHNYLENSKAFMKMFRKTTKKKHSNFIINYSNDPQDLYMDMNFMPVKIEEK